MLSENTITIVHVMTSMYIMHTIIRVIWNTDERTYIEV